MHNISPNGKSQNFLDFYLNASNSELDISINDLNASNNDLTPLLPRVGTNSETRQIQNKKITNRELSKETSYGNWKLIEEDDMLTFETLEKAPTFRTFRITNPKSEAEIRLELVCENCSSDKVSEETKKNLRMFYGQVVYFNIRDDKYKVFCEFPMHRNNKIITTGHQNVLKLLGIMKNFSDFDPTLVSQWPEIFKDAFKESILYPNEQYIPSAGWLISHNVNEVWRFEQKKNGKVGKKISIKPSSQNLFLLIYSKLKINTLNARCDRIIEGTPEQLIEKIKKILGVSYLIKETALVFRFLLGLLLSKNN